MASRWNETATAGLQASAKAPKCLAPDRCSADPYARWALLTRWRGYTHTAGRREAFAGGNSAVHVIAHTTDTAWLQAQCSPAPPDPELRVSPAYGQTLPGTAHVPPYFTATLSMQQLEAWLWANPRGLRWRLAFPLRDAEGGSQLSPMSWFGEGRDPESTRARNRVQTEIERLKQSHGGVLDYPRGLAGAIALIDHGCPFLNDAFSDPAALAAGLGARGTRLAAVWDQGSRPDRVDKQGQPEPGWPWQPAQMFQAGRELGPLALKAICRVASGARRLEETSIYRGIDYLIDYDDERRRVWFGTHGGHLLDVVAGRPDPVSGTDDDHAGEARLVFVQLPSTTAMDSSGASLSAHLLDGTRYALSLVQAGAPLVLNISYGGQAGPHDGSSIFEEALDDLIEHAVGNFAVVLAAGNSRLARCHAQRRVRPNRSALLRMQMPDGDTTDSFVELWYATPDVGTVELRARQPNGLWSPWVAAGQQALLRSETAAQDVVAMLRHDSHVPNGRRAMALLALAPTAQPRNVACELADAGIWVIETRLCEDARGQVAPELVLDAWIERDEPGRDGGKVRPFFVDQNERDDEGSLCSIASGRLTWRVGGFNAGTGQEAPYSACGPGHGGEWLPQLLAACEEDEVNPSVSAAATRSVERVRLNGTSVAAPVFARRLYNHLREWHEHHPRTPVRGAAAWRELVDTVIAEHPLHLRAHPKP